MSKALPEWNGLNDNDIKKRYFKILEKVAEENRQYFLKNDNYLIQRSKEKYSNKWKMYVPDSKLLKEIKEIEKISKDMRIDTLSGLLSYVESLST